MENKKSRYHMNDDMDIGKKKFLLYCRIWIYFIMHYSNQNFYITKDIYIFLYSVAMNTIK